MTGPKTVEFSARRGLEVPLSELDEGTVRALKAAFTYKNPQYAKSKRMGFYVDDMPETIENYEVEDGVLVLPRGATEKVRSVLKRHYLEAEFVDDRWELAPVDWEPGFHAETVELDGFQEDLVQAILARENCLVRSAGGSGKTEIGLEAMRRAGQPALVIVWSAGLLKQWVGRVKKRFGWTDREIGVLGSGKRRIGGAVTIGMQQTLWSIADEVAGEFGFVLVDEVQRAAARTLRESLAKFPARYRVGLSEDEKRKDRLEVLTYDHFGEVLKSVDREELIKRGRICEVRIVVIPTGFRYGPFEDLDDRIEAAKLREEHQLVDKLRQKKSRAYVEAIDAMTANEPRNKLILDLVQKCRDERHWTLVFSERTDHCLELSRRLSLERGVTCGALLGGAENQTAFDETIGRLNEGKISAAIGTSCVYQGTDAPRLDRGIVTTPTAANQQLLGQQTARLRRVSPATGKSGAVLYYLWDEHLFPTHLGLLRRWYGKRLVTVDDGPAR